MINIILNKYHLQNNGMFLKCIEKNIHYFFVATTYIYLSLYKYLYLVLLNYY
jgi:hypothetical protein